MHNHVGVFFAEIMVKQMSYHADPLFFNFQDLRFKIFKAYVL